MGKQQGISFLASTPDYDASLFTVGIEQAKINPFQDNVLGGPWLDSKGGAIEVKYNCKGCD